MRFPILICLLALSACASSGRGYVDPEDAAANGNAYTPAVNLNAPAGQDTSSCPGDFPGSTTFENSREGVGSFFCD